MFGYGFIEAVEQLEAWAIKHNIIEDENEHPVFKDIGDGQTDENDGLMFIPDGIDEMIE